MMISIGEEELSGHDCANIPCNIFISKLEPGGSEEERAMDALRDRNIRGFVPKWTLTADVFMPRKGLAEGCYRYVADTREELDALVREHILPSYKIAFDAITAMAEGRRSSFYYWTEKSDD